MAPLQVAPWSPVAILRGFACGISFRIVAEAQPTFARLDTEGARIAHFRADRGEGKEPLGLCVGAQQEREGRPVDRAARHRPPHSRQTATRQSQEPGRETEHS